MGETFAFMSAFFFGVSNILIKKGFLRTSRNESLLITSIINSCILLTVLFILILSGNKVTFLVSGISLFILAGILTTFAGRFFLFKGIDLIGPVRTGPFKVTTPLYAVLAAALFLGERPGIMFFLGTGIVLFGLLSVVIGTIRSEPKTIVGESKGVTDLDKYILIVENKLQPATRNILVLGMLMASLSAASFGVGSVVRKMGLMYIPNAVLGAFIGSLVAVVFNAAIFLRENNRAGFRKVQWPPNPLVISGGLTTTVAQLAAFLMVFYTSVSRAAVISSIEPLIVIMLSSLLLKEERINLRFLLGTLLTIVGIIIVILG